MNFAPKLIIGLGNPDPEYKNTYHNVGHLFIDYLNSDPNLQIHPNLQMVKSAAYMNESGNFVLKELKKNNAEPDELLVVHDDSDLALGNYKLQFGRGSAGHHGIESVQTALKTKDFWRLRIGIRFAADQRRTNADLRGLQRGLTRKKAGEFVLKKISKADMALLEKVFAEIVEKLTAGNPRKSAF